MADKLYKIGDPIDLGYQAPNKESGLTIIAEIYLPGKVKDSNFPDVTLDEVGNSGTYRGTFTPDDYGTWQVILHKDDGEGQVTKSYSVGGYNVESVGVAVGTVDGKVVAVDGKVDNVQSKVNEIDSEVDALGVVVSGVDDKVDNLTTIVGGLDTPPMAF